MPKSVNVDFQFSADGKDDYVVLLGCLILVVLFLLFVIQEITGWAVLSNLGIAVWFFGALGVLLIVLGFAFG